MALMFNHPDSGFEVSGLAPDEKSPPSHADIGVTPFDFQPFDFESWSWTELALSALSPPNSDASGDSQSPPNDSASDDGPDNEWVDEPEICVIESALYNCKYHCSGVLSWSNPDCPAAFSEGGLPDHFIDTFLERCGLYDRDQRRWHEIPEAPSDRSALLAPLHTILQVILDQFSPRTLAVISKRPKAREDAPRFWRSPFLAVHHLSATGAPSDSGGSGLALSTGYHSCATAMDVKLSKDRWLLSDIIQLAIYASECFSKQPTRSSVELLLLTEKDVQLFHFARKRGVRYWNPLDIHQNPREFIRLALETSLS